MKLRPLIENPFRNYAVFSGRAGRAEFWLFILTFIVITQLAWLLGFGVMKIAGFDRNHDRTSPHNVMEQSEYGGASKDALSSAQPDDSSSDERSSDDRSKVYRDKNGHDDDMLNFMIHRHGGDGYHLHGIMRDDHMFEYDREGLGYDNDHVDNDHGDNDHGDNDHGRYEYRGYHDDRHVYIRFHESRAERGGDILWMISVAALLLPLLAVGARRLHDSNHSGWWQLLALIPVAGWLVLAVFFLLASEEEDNRFGAPSAV